MPYGSDDELQPAVADHLPPRTQHIFREAFNHAWEEHDGDEERAFRVAYAAVKRSFHKRGNVCAENRQNLSANYALKV